MSDPGAGERNLAPTAKRRGDAIKNGDVLRSREMGTAAGMLVGAIWLRFAGPWVYSTLAGALRGGFVWNRGSLAAFDPRAALFAVVMAAMPPVLVLGVAIGAASLGSQLGFGEGRFRAANLVPKPSRLDPLAGFKRMFGIGGVIELGKGLLKVTLLGTIAAVWALHHLDRLTMLGRAGLSSQLTLAWDALTTLLFALSAGLLLIAFIDLPIQWLRRMKRLRMTLQEVNDERKETDGAPEKKQAIRDRQRALARGSIAGALRQAQFVVTNPMHFAIALSYDPKKASAPVVLARGRGEKAMAMRELAGELDLPVLEYPALARALYYSTRERQMIHEELYAAVASVLAFVMALKRGDPIARPRVEVPVTLRFDTEGRLESPAASAFSV